MGISGGTPDGDTNPPVEPKTPEEASWWSEAAPHEHGAFGVAGSVLLLSAVSLIAIAFGITITPEDMYNIAILGLPAPVVIIPPAAVAAGKAIAASAAGVAVRQGIKHGPKLAKKGVKKAKEVGTKVKERLKKCAHLKPGKGKGGAHSETTKPKGDGKDSHHMPADGATSLPKKDGPAIKMDPLDHKKTSSNGQRAGHEAYIESVADLLKEGKWRDALAKEIKDVRRVAGKKYNEAIREMMEYAKCLGKHGLLK
jgi:hypothetical protein